MKGYRLNILPWRCKWSPLSKMPVTQILKTCPICCFSSSPTICPDVATKTQESFSQENHGVTLTPQIVQSTLLNCSSDLIALSFFVWCAKQRNYFHNSQAFDHMVSVVSRLTGQYKTVKAIVKELESVGFVIKAQTFLLLLRIYWRGGMHGMVFKTYQQMISFGFTPNSFACNVVMDVLFKIGRVDAGLRILKETQSPNFLTYSIALSNLCKLDDVANVKDVLHGMLRKGYYPNVEALEMVLNCFCRKGMLIGAYQVLGIMITLGISVSVNTWSMLIDGFCRLRQPVMAGFLLKKMVDSGCSPNVVTYTTLIRGYMECHMVADAFGVLDAMESNSCGPDLVMCNMLIDKLAKIGRYNDAFLVFIGLSKWNLVPDSYTLSSLLSNLCCSRRFSLLPELVKGLATEADLVVCNSLLNYFCEAGLPFLAVKLFCDMVDKEITPDKYSFVGLLRGLCAIGRTDEAVNIYHEIVMSFPHLDAHIHTAMVGGLIRSGECHRAIGLFRKALLEKYPLDGVSCTVAIFGLIKGGRTGEASTLYEQMKENGLFPSAQIYSIMLHGFCMERDIGMVKKLLEEIIEARVQLDRKTIIRLTKFVFKFHLSSSLFNQLTGLWNLGLMPEEAMCEPLFNGFSPTVKVNDANQSILDVFAEDKMVVDSSCSDDLSDVAASVG